VPLDVLQKVLGHASLQTTTIYVQAEKKRSIDELGEFFRGRK
jgi:site-specific recombinase XerD